ncbi:hypothetical protein, conserved [Plasmodium gonderi]|uniref:Uncharacterized protein n=1 Tax=Plasmodium gonderi TaxID=77519 RepID=A0A1Y1JDG5_PLAGO|nr:hypothetical protein, conserved [Plasmodium gonderi]GAW80280.1 hypothetical protein, conserved [Plasmodium gonderi]
MDLRNPLFLLIYFLTNSMCYICFNPNLDNTSSSRKIHNIFKKKCYMKSSNKIFLKSKKTKFQLSLIFRKQKDQSMIRSIPSHVRKKKKKKKKKKKAKTKTTKLCDLYNSTVLNGKKPRVGEEKKVNKKLMRRRLLKYYKLKRKNEGTEENIFADKEKYSIFDYVENKLSGTTIHKDNFDKYHTNVINKDKETVDKGRDTTFIPPIALQGTDITGETPIHGRHSNTNNMIDHMGNVQKLSYPAEIREDQDGRENKRDDERKIFADGIQSDSLPKTVDPIQEGNKLGEISNQNDERENITSEVVKKKKKKKLKKLKKNMHIGKYNRKIFTYPKKISVDDVHEYIENKHLDEKYILQKDTLKNVFVNKPLFNFYNFYNFFKIDHIEKYNKSKVLNLIYYYIYKYKNNVESQTKYESVKTDDIMQTYENIADDKKKMKHYLEFYINMNNNKYLYMNIDKDYTLKKKITDAFTISNINKVDSLHLHNYKVVWTVRNVQEKLFWRFREMGNIPLMTSAFSFAGKKSFKLKIWLDGHKSAKKGYVSVALKQVANYGLLEEYICMSLGGITKGPFLFLSKEYYQSCYNFCKFDELDLKNDELQLSVFVYDGIV